MHVGTFQMLATGGQEAADMIDYTHNFETLMKHAKIKYSVAD